MSILAVPLLTKIIQKTIRIISTALIFSSILTIIIIANLPPANLTKISPHLLQNLILGSLSIITLYLCVRLVRPPYHNGISTAIGFTSVGFVHSFALGTPNLPVISFFISLFSTIASLIFALFIIVDFASREKKDTPRNLL